MFKAIIFDFDGVLHDTFEFHRKRISEFTGHNLTGEEYRKVHDGNFFDYEVKALKDADWYEYKEAIADEFVDLDMDRVTKKEIESLSDNYKLYIISSSGGNNIRRYLQNNSVSGKFEEVLGLESHKSKVEKLFAILDKYGYNKDDVVFVTDTLGDILEANEVGVKTIAVTFGYHEEKRLLKGRPWKIVKDFKEVKKAVKR